PADVPALERLNAVCPELPHDVAYLFSQIGGTQEIIGAGFQLMSIANLFSFYDDTGDEISQSLYGELLDPRVMLPLFWEGGGNYAGIFVGGPLRGRCFIHDHGEPLNLPVFQNLGRMILAFAKVHDLDDIYFDNLTGDYPSRDASQLLADDVELSKRFLKQYFEEKPRDSYWALLGMQLSPASDTGILLRMLDEDDVWIQAKACELIGFRRFVGGIDGMIKVALRGANNPTIATLVALRDWDDPKAVAGLKLLKESLPNGFSGHW
ncbi:MAG: hypothetical protein AAGC70_12440, partial [Pseudomonadota bacterium]